MSDFAALTVRESARRHAWAILAGFAAALAGAMLCGVCAGRLPIGAETALAIIADRILPGTGIHSWSELEERIVLLVRAPRVLMAAAAGAGLAMGGAALQGVFRNPLVSPQILGVSSGAAFGGSLALLFGFAGAILVSSAFVFGVLALVLVGFVARLGGGTDTATVVLAGIVVGALFAALVSFTQFLADPNSSLLAIVGWLMGSFATVTWERMFLVAVPLAIGMAVIHALRFRVNVLSLGEDDATAFGVPVQRDRWIIFLAVALITGSVVSVAGMVGWVGLVVPHAARLLVGSDHRILIPASALAGGAYLVVIDTIARTATAAEIPLGVLTAMVGAPVFALLLRAAFRGARS